jgi:hypothetical protein
MVIIKIRPSVIIMAGAALGLLAVAFGKMFLQRRYGSIV